MTYTRCVAFRQLIHLISKLKEKWYRLINPRASSALYETWQFCPIVTDEHDPRSRLTWITNVNSSLSEWNVIRFSQTRYVGSVLFVICHWNNITRYWTRSAMLFNLSNNRRSFRRIDATYHLKIMTYRLCAVARGATINVAMKINNERWKFALCVLFRIFLTF